MSYCARCTQKSSPYGELLKFKINELKVCAADCLAVIRLCAGSSLLDEGFNLLAEEIGEITGGHHAETLKKVLNLGSNDVTHEKWGKEVKILW